MTVDELLGLEAPADGETSELAERLRVIQDAVRALYEIKAQIIMELAARMEDRVVPVDGVGLLVRNYKVQSSWKDRDASEMLRHDIREAVVKRYAVNQLNGDVDPGVRNLVRQVVDDLWEVVPSFSSVKRPARRMGIDIRDYRTFTEVPTVVVADDLPEDE